jgi:predicted nucleic-acid-binding protein
MRAVDTNLLVRLVVRDDVKQARRADAFVAPGAWVAQLVLAETVWVLDSVYGLGRSDQALAVDMLLSHDRLTIQDAEGVEAALELFRSGKGVGFSDCLVLASAQRAGHLPLGTFDRRLSRLPGTEQL